MKKDWDIAVCGLNCAKCPLYLIPDDREAAENVLYWFKEQGWLDDKITVEEFMKENGRECEGCRGPKDKRWTPDCFFVNCANEKGHETCADCDCFPCEKLIKFANDGAPHHAKTVANLKRIKEIGMASFLKSQDKIFFCP